MTGYDFASSPDIERALMKMLRERFSVLATPPGGPLRVATEVPSNVGDIVTATVPFVRVSVIGGGSGRLEIRPLVDVDVFSKDRDTSMRLAVSIEAWLLDYPHRTTLDSNFVLLDEVSTVMVPQRVPWPDGTLKRYLSSYQISARR